MPVRKNLTKEQRIRREITRLQKVFRDIDENKAKVIQSLIENAAFTIVSLEEVQEIINREGYTEPYQHGAGQSGTKQSEAVKIHIAMTKNLVTVAKQLTELVPPAKTKESALERMMSE